MSTVTLYGIKNCDTVKKARQWLDKNGIQYHFHDFREDGLTADQVRKWVGELGWKDLVNKRSTTWKALEPAVKDSLDSQSVIQVILQSPTLIKRPLLDTGKYYHTGFKAADYEKLLL